MPATTAYPFVAARYDYGPGLVPRAILVHMAEGGNTAGYLSRSPARGVSVHFVVDVGGRIIQMLPLDHISGSVNPGLLRGVVNRLRRAWRPDDPPFTGYNGERIVYGATAARAVLGDLWRDPNRACVSIEVEGFATSGPNVAQRKALVLLSRDLRERLPTLRGNLGHRDLAAYKACPGRAIPWANMGGHGPFRD